MTALDKSECRPARPDATGHRSPEGLGKVPSGGMVVEDGIRSLGLVVRREHERIGLIAAVERLDTVTVHQRAGGRIADEGRQRPQRRTFQADGRGRRSPAARGTRRGIGAERRLSHTPHWGESSRSTLNRGVERFAPPPSPRWSESLHPCPVAKLGTPASGVTKNHCFIRKPSHLRCLPRFAEGIF